VPPEPKPMDEEPARRVRALRAFTELVAARETPPGTIYETTVLSRADLGGDATLLLYAIPRSEAPDRILLSGWLHARLPPGADRPSPLFAPTEAPVTIDRDQALGDPTGPVLFAEDVPAAEHVFASLRFALPLWVVTDAGIWRVAEGEVAWIGRPGG